MISNNDLEAIVEAYRRGMTADMLQAQIDGKWSHYWTVPPCSPSAMAEAGRKFARMRAERLRYIRHAILEAGKRGQMSTIIITELPARTQMIIHLDEGRILKGISYLTDATLASLEKELSLK